MSAKRSAALTGEDDLDVLCRQMTAFTSFQALLTAAAEYRPSICLDLLGREGAVLAEAYNRAQFDPGNSRRAFVTGEIPPVSVPV